MKINVEPKEGLMFNSIMLLFIIHSIQTGTGIVGLPRVVYNEVEQDSWIALLLTGVILSITIIVIVHTLNFFDSADLFGIHYEVFGKVLGNFISIIFIIYFFSILFTVITNYTEMVQAWLFPSIPTWTISLILSFLAVYAVLGGVRVIIGTSIVSISLTIWLLFAIYFPLKDMDYTRFFPIWNHSLIEMGKGIMKTSYSMSGYEILFLLYPYIKDKKNTLKYTLISSNYTILIYTLFIFIAIGFFSDESLKKTIWPVLTIFKIVQLPNIERFEIIAISFWMLIVLPNICFYLWAATKGLKRCFQISQRTSVYFVALLVVVLSFFIRERYTMDRITTYVNNFGFYMVFSYPYFLYIVVLIKKKWLKRSGIK